MKIKLNNKDVTNLASSLNISSSIDSLSNVVSISFPNYKDTTFYVDVFVGDKIEIDKFFKGIVVDISYNEDEKTIKVFDSAFYLNQTKILKQIRNTTTDKAIKLICSELGLNIVINGNLNQKINMMFKNKSVSEVIKDMLEIEKNVTGKEYHIYSYNDKLYIEENGLNEISLTLKINENEILDKDKVFFDMRINENIEELKNVILVVSDNEKSLLVLAKEKDEKSIEKYGALQEIIEFNSKEHRSIKSVAKTMLNTLNKIKKKIEVSVMSDNFIQAGKSVNIKETKYLIVSTNLNFENNMYNGSLTLKELF